MSEVSYKHLRPVGQPDKFLMAGFFPEPPAADPGFEWVEGYPPEGATDFVPYEKLSTRGKIAALLSQGQEQMSGNPLPFAIQQQIFSLETTLYTILDRKLYDTAIELVRNFALPFNGAITPVHRAAVEQIQAMMIAAIQAEKAANG